jgi:hypothetical protein
MTVPDFRTVESAQSNIDGAPGRSAPALPDRGRWPRTPCPARIRADIRLQRQRPRIDLLQHHRRRLSGRRLRLGRICRLGRMDRCDSHDEGPSGRRPRRTARRVGATERTGPGGPGRDVARRFCCMRRARRRRPGPADKAGPYLRVLDELAPAAAHLTEQYGNNRIEADHGRLKARLRPMRGLKRLRSAARIFLIDAPTGEPLVAAGRGGIGILNSDQP